MASSPSSTTLSSISSNGRSRYRTVNTPSFIASPSSSSRRLDAHVDPGAFPVASAVRLDRPLVPRGLVERGEGRVVFTAGVVCPDLRVDVDHQVPPRIGPPLLVTSRAVRERGRPRLEQRRIPHEPLIGAIAVP